MSLLDNLFGLWWVAVWATATAIVTIVGALHGSSAHRTARLMMGVALCGIAASYWWDLAARSNVGPAELRRGAGIVLWPSVVWVAWSGISYAARQNRTAQIVLDAYRDGPEDE